MPDRVRFGFMTNAELLNLLERSEYFRGLSKHSRKSLVSACTPQTVSKRDCLFWEGQKGHSIFLLASGSVQLVKTSEDGKEVVIKTVEPGEVFAEVVLFEQDSYPVTAIAIRKSKVYKLPKTEFVRLLRNEDFRSDFIAYLMKRLRYLADRILYLTAYYAETRFFRFLKDQYGEKEQYEISMSKKDIASAIGTVPETFSRLLLRLDEQGQLVWRGKILRLKPNFWNE